MFQTVIRQTSSHAALVGPEGRTLYQTGVEPGPSANEPYVTATSPVPGTKWHVRVAAPRSAIAPEIGSTVTTLLVVNYAILTVLLIGLGLFAYLEWREYSNRLERLQQMAQQNKLATLGMMAASTSHEINNALSAAQLQLELARKKADQEDEIQEHLDTVTSSVNRLGDLAKNLSNYASQGDTDFHNSPLRASLEDALEVVRPKLGSDTQLDVEVEANPTVHGAPDALKQVFVNLILNALEEIEKRSDARIAVHVDRREDTAVFTVTDNGTGLPPEIIGDIFDPFVTTKSEQGGTGIGLWLSSRIVEQHGGKIHARNIENGGARFTVELPVAGGNADTDQKLAATEPTADNPVDNGASSVGN